MAKPPKQVKLINYDWEVAVVDQHVVDADMIMLGPPGSFCGNCNKREKRIYISKVHEAQEMPRTFLHEVLHACLINSHDILTADLEEKVVCRLEERLTDLIKNNPKAIKYLQENL